MTQPGSGKQVLIIDDDDDLAAALTVLLEGAGYRIRRAADGAEGVRMAAEQPPDLIILDLMMPVKNGFEACDELQQIPALRDVPILAITAFGQDIGEVYGARREGAPASVRDCLEKPIEANVLLDRMASALAQR